MRLPNSKNAGYTSNVTIEAGALNEDSFLLASWYTAKNCGVNWVAPTAKFSNYAENTAFINIKKGGYVEFGADGVPGAINFQDVGGIVNIPADDALAAKVAAAISSIDEGAYAGFGWYDAENEKTLDLAAKKAVFAGKNIAKQGSGTLYLDGLDGVTLGDISIWDGTLVLPHGVKADTITVADGAKLVIDLAGAVDDETVLTYSASSGTIEYRNLRAGAKVTTETIDGITTCTLSSGALTYIWDGQDGAAWFEPSNWLMDDGSPASDIPTSDDNFIINGDAKVSIPSGAIVGKVTVNSGTFTITPGVTFTSLTLASETTVAFDASSLISTIGGSADLVTINSASGVSATSFELPGNYTGAFANGVLTATRQAASFVWNGSTIDNNWTTAKNWRIDGNEVFDTPVNGDSVEFPAINNQSVEYWTVTLTGDVYPSEVNVNANIRLSGGRTLKTTTINGSAELQLDNANLGCNDGELTINCTLNILPGTRNYIYLGPSKNNAWNVQIHGSLQGSGELIADHAGKQGIGVKFHGDNSGFSGTFTSSNYNQRDCTDMADSSSSSSNAVWNVYTYNNNNQDWIVNNTETFYFGALNGGLQYSYDSKKPYETAKIEVGARDDVESEFALAVWSSQKVGYDVRKVGNNKMTITGKGNSGGYNVFRLHNLVIAGGTVWIPSLPDNMISFEEKGGVLSLGTDDTGDLYDPSGLIKGSNGVIGYNDNGTNSTWATAIADSNTGGFAKYGAGTLTLKEMPLYTGVTSIMDGKIVFPAQLDATENKEIVLNPLSAGTYENAILTGYAYPAGTVLDGTETADDMRTEFAIDVSGVVKVDLSADNETIINALKTNRQWILAASAEGITGFRRGQIELVPPAKPEDVSEVMWQWTVGVVAVKGGYALAVMPESNPTRIIIR